MNLGQEVRAGQQAGQFGEHLQMYSIIGRANQKEHIGQMSAAVAKWQAAG